MQIVAVSDVHGNDAALCRVLERETAQHIFCLGDGVREYEAAAERYPDRTFYIVYGNCDYTNVYPAVGLTTLGGKRVMYMHGHTKFVKRTLEPALALARESKADLLLFGHTHCSVAEKDGAVLACNPGSLGYNGTYMVLSWDEGGGEITAVKKEV